MISTEFIGFSDKKQQSKGFDRMTSCVANQRLTLQPPRHRKGKTNTFILVEICVHGARFILSVKCLWLFQEVRLSATDHRIAAFRSRNSGRT